ncbi:diguanylate cyclase domain-containing protein [Mycobacterium sp. SMC-4]|uniref:diguanylate cyclase domain-containing protein n=1 Tax=Mycobacterium sp. SMC-4 TaxID=2857059 RepID=UPI003D077852
MQPNISAPAPGAAGDADADVAEDRYRRLLDGSLSPICRHDGRIVHYVNSAAVRALGMSSQHQIVGRPIDDFVDPQSLAGVRVGLDSLITDGDVSEPVEVTMRRIDGTTVSLHSVSTLRIGADGRFYEVVCAAPVSTPKQNVRVAAPTDTAGHRHEADDHLYAVLDLLHVGVMIMGSDGRIQFTNEAARRILGSNTHDLTGLHHSSSGLALRMYDAQGAWIGADAHPVRWILETGLGIVGEVIGVDRFDGRRAWVTGNGCLLDPQNPDTSPVMLSFTDITEHYDARERLRHEATHDWLTGLPNRVHALDHAAAALVATGSDRLAAVLFLDLNGMKAVNDKHGHPAGDDVLRVAARRMRAAVRAQDLVARIGGDEFLVLLRGSLRTDELDGIVTRLQDALAADISVGSRLLRIGVSVGATVVAEDDRRSLAEVLHDADAAMYQVKAEARSATTESSDG